MLKLVKFFNGGVDYGYLMNAPLIEVFTILELSNVIAKDEKDEIARLMKK